MVLVDVKSLEGHFFGGIPVVSCHLWTHKGITVCHPQYRCHVWYVYCLLQYIFWWFWWVIWEKNVIPASVTQMKKDRDLLPSRCFLKSWHLMREDSGMGWRKSKFLSLWSRRGKQTGPPKAMFVAFFKAFWFELKHDYGRKDGWWLVHSKVFVWCLPSFGEDLLFGIHLTTRTTGTNLNQVETTKAPSDRRSSTSIGLSCLTAMQIKSANWILHDLSADPPTVWVTVEIWYQISIDLNGFHLSIVSSEFTLATAVSLQDPCIFFWVACYACFPMERKRLRHSRTCRWELACRDCWTWWHYT